MQFHKRWACLATMAFASCAGGVEHIVPNECAGFHGKEQEAAPPAEVKEVLEFLGTSITTDADGTPLDAHYAGLATVGICTRILAKGARPVTFQIRYESELPGTTAEKVDLVTRYAPAAGSLQIINEIVPLPAGPLPATVRLWLEHLHVDGSPVGPDSFLLCEIPDVRPGINGPFDSCCISNTPSDLQLLDRSLHWDHDGKSLCVRIQNTSDLERKVAVGCTVTDITFDRHRTHGNATHTKPALDTTTMPLVTQLAPHTIVDVTVPFIVNGYHGTPLLLFTVNELFGDSREVADPAVRGQMKMVAWGWWNLEKYHTLMGLNKTP